MAEKEAAYYSIRAPGEQWRTVRAFSCADAACRLVSWHDSAGITRVMQGYPTRMEVMAPGAEHVDVFEVSVRETVEYVAEWRGDKKAEDKGPSEKQTPAERVCEGCKPGKNREDCELRFCRWHPDMIENATKKGDDDGKD